MLFCMTHGSVLTPSVNKITTTTTTVSGVLTRVQFWTKMWRVCVLIIVQEKNFTFMRKCQRR